jgi:hypothetical protein
MASLVPDELTAFMDLINEQKKIIDEVLNPGGYSYMV